MDAINTFFKEVESVISQADSFDKPYKRTILAKLTNSLCGDKFDEIADSFNDLYRVDVTDEYRSEVYEKLINANNDDSEEDSEDFAEKKGDAFSKFLNGKIHKILWDDIFKKNKVIGSISFYTFKFCSDYTNKKLLSIPDMENRILYAKVIARELDAKLYSAFDDISFHDEKGCNSFFIRRDIIDFLNDIVANFSLFDIDLTEYLKNESDFEKEFGNYDEFRADKFNKEVVVSESEHSKSVNKDLNQPGLFKEYLICPDIDDLLERLHSYITNDSQTKKLATVVLALEKMKYLKKPYVKAKLYKSMRTEFSLNHLSENPDGFNQHFRKGQITDSEIEYIISALIKHS